MTGFSFQYDLGFAWAFHFSEQKNKYILGILQFWTKTNAKDFFVDFLESHLQFRMFIADKSIVPTNRCNCVKVTPILLQTVFHYVAFVPFGVKTEEENEQQIFFINQLTGLLIPTPQLWYFFGG